MNRPSFCVVAILLCACGAARRGVEMPALPDQEAEAEASPETTDPCATSREGPCHVGKAQVHDRIEIELPARLDRRLAHRLRAVAEEQQDLRSILLTVLSYRGTLDPSFAPGLIAAEKEGGAGGGLERFYTLTIGDPRGKTLIEISRELVNAGAIRAAPAPRYKPTSEDPYVGFEDKVDVDDVKRPCGSQWYLHRIRAKEAWGCSTGKGVVVAVLDWGFVAHAELEGRVEPENAYSMCTRSRRLEAGSRHSHGTGVSGQIAASRNGKGIQGVAYDARIWEIQAGCEKSVDSLCVSPRNDDLGRAGSNPWADAIIHVTNENAEGRRKVLVLETQTCCEENVEASVAISHAIATAIERGVVVVVAAGNGDRDAGLDDQGSEIPPTGSILVGYTEFNGRRGRLSNHGDRITVSAPGDPQADLTLGSPATQCGAGQFASSGYTPKFGWTSGAAAKVAGVVALMLAENPLLGPGEVKERLVKGGVLVDDPCGKRAGVHLNAAKAVEAANPKTCNLE